MKQKDEVVASIQRELAAQFVETMSANAGLTLDYGAQSISQLDEYAATDLCNTDQALGEALGVWRKAMGAYLGEVLVRTLRGSWTWDEKEGPTVALPGGEVASPEGWVNNRLVAGHRLKIMYDIADGLASGMIDPNDPKWPATPN